MLDRAELEQARDEAWAAYRAEEEQNITWEEFQARGDELEKAVWRFVAAYRAWDATQRVSEATPRRCVAIDDATLDAIILVAEEIAEMGGLALIPGETVGPERVVLEWARQARAAQAEGGEDA